MADLKARLWRGVEQAERAQSPAAFVAFAREFRQCLESRFEISQRIAGKLLQARANTGLAEAIASGRAKLRHLGQQEQVKSCEAKREDS